MFTDEQKALLATGIIKAEGNMTSGDAHLAVNYPLLLENSSGPVRSGRATTGTLHAARACSLR
jgi:pyruvate-formate lyase